MSGSKTFDACCRIFNAMLETSEALIDDDEFPRRWEGKLTFLFEDVGIGSSHYSRIINFLKDLGCIEQETRGSSHTPSVWVLLKKPDYTEFERLMMYLRQNTQRPSLTQIDINRELKHIHQRIDKVMAKVLELEGSEDE